MKPTLITIMLAFIVGVSVAQTMDKSIRIIVSGVKDTTYMEKYVASIVTVYVSQGNTFEYRFPCVSNQLLKVYKVQNIKNHELEEYFLDEKKSVITLPYGTKFIKANW